MNGPDADVVGAQIGAQIGVLDRNVAVLTARYETINGKLVGLDAKLDALAGELGRSRQTPWPLIISGLMATMVMIGGGWALVDLQTRLTVAQQTTPLATDLANLQARVGEARDRSEAIARVQQDRGERVSTLEQQAAASGVERQDLAARQERMAVIAGTQGERITSIETSLTEVESQFCWLSDQLNIRLSGRGQFIQLMWEKLMGQRMMPENDIPRVGRCG